MEPFSFTISLEDFDKDLLPIDPDLLKQDSGLFEKAVSEYYLNELQKLDGNARVVVKDGAVTVQFSPDLEGGLSGLEKVVMGLLRSNAMAEAESMLRSILKHHPRNLFALFNLGMLLSDKKDIDGALKLLTTLVEVNPSHAGGWNALGVAHSRNGDEDKAFESLKKSVELEPDNGYSVRNYANLLARKAPKAALPVMRKASELLPNDQLTALSYANALLNAGEDAELQFKKVIELNKYSDYAEDARKSLSKIAEKSMRGKVDGDLRKDVVMYCLSALETFCAMDQQALNAVAMELSLLGRTGLNINSLDKKYTLKSLPGEFTAMQLVSHLYVAIQKIAPGQDIGIDLSREYEAALTMFEKKQ